MSEEPQKMSLEEAKTALGQLAERKIITNVDYLDRAEFMMERPDTVNQGEFGVCGMTCALRSLLQSDLGKFIDLMYAVFDPTKQDFMGIYLEGGGTLLSRREKEIVAKGSKRGSMGDRYDLDFILARSLGKLMKIKSRPMYDQQLEFGRALGAFFDAKVNPVDLFSLSTDCVTDMQNGDLTKLKVALNDNAASVQSAASSGVDLDNIRAQKIPGQVAKWEVSIAAGDGRLILSVVLKDDTWVVQVAPTGIIRREGDLALNAAGLLYIMTDVLKVRTASIMSAENINKDKDAVNAVLAQDGSFVYVAVNDIVRFRRAKAAAVENRKAGSPPFVFNAEAQSGPSIQSQPPADFEHWVALNGKIRTDGNMLIFPVWTWARTFEVLIPEQYVGGYIRAYVGGQI